MQQLVEQLLVIIDRAYDHKSWHGTNLRGSIRGLGAAEVAWRPSRRRHNIWEIAVHAAYWKYVCWRRLTGADRGSFALKGSNWFERGDAIDEKAWRSDVALLDASHKQLRQAITELDDKELSITPAGSKVSNLELLSGIAAHDLYHAGQIQLLKKLRPRT